MPTNTYTSQTISGYNASPPPDDGSQSAANQLEWQKHIDKIGDPLKTLAESIDSAALAAIGALIMTDDPGEETVMVAVEQLVAAGVAAHVATSKVSRARQADNATAATSADAADDLSDFTENVVVAMQEFT